MKVGKLGLQISQTSEPDLPAKEFQTLQNAHVNIYTNFCGYLEL